jgi:hypothetical protein
VREGETQGNQDQSGAKKKAKSCTESDQGTEAVGVASKSNKKKKTYKGSKTNHVNSSNSIEKFQVVVTKGNTEFSNINKGIYPKGDG